jgi:hypothetical protein
MVAAAPHTQERDLDREAVFMPGGTIHRPHEAMQATGSFKRSRIPSGVGRTLRDARVVAGVPLADVEVQTGIEARYRRALEWERFDLLPDTKFARRAAQAEAQVLRLDPELILEELERTHESRPRYGTVNSPVDADPAATTLGDPATVTPVAIAAAPPDPPATEPALAAQVDSAPITSHWHSTDGDPPARDSGFRASMPSPRYAFAGALLAGLVRFLIVDFFVLINDEDPSASQPPAVEAPAPPAATTIEPQVPLPVQPASTGGLEPRASSGAAPVMPDPSGASAVSRVPTTDNRGAQAGESQDSAESQDSPPAVAPRSVQSVEIKTARGASWLQVRARSASGPILYEGILARGGAVNFEQRAVFIRAGAASALNIFQDGELVSKELEGTIDLRLTRKNGLRVTS